jgi:hypothetical protein
MALSGQWAAVKPSKDTIYRGSTVGPSGALRHKTCDRTVVSLVSLQNVNEAELGKVNEANVQNRGFRTRTLSRPGVTIGIDATKLGLQLSGPPLQFCRNRRFGVDPDQASPRSQAWKSEHAKATPQIRGTEPPRQRPSPSTRGRGTATWANHTMSQ